MTLSKHDEDFANAMALKLRLNREARKTEARLREDMATSDMTSQPDALQTIRKQAQLARANSRSRP